ncbi:MAG: PsbP-related protein [bacterium]|nr:PsbP-related protein [bacterium]
MRTKMKSGFTVIEAVIIVVLIAVVVAGIAMTKKKQAVTTEPTAAPATTEATKTETKTTTAAKTDKMADWKTYSNTKYGFSFKYPSDWKMSENGGNNADPSVVSIVSPETQKAPGSSPDDMSVYYYPSVADEPENKLNKLGATTLDDMIKKNSMITKIGSTEIGGVQATDVIWGGLGSYYAILTTKNSHLYKVWFSNTSDKSMLTSVEKQILASFTFTK